VDATSAVETLDEFWFSTVRGRDGCLKRLKNLRSSAVLAKSASRAESDEIGDKADIGRG
jgi:hypothetical protein